MAKVKRALGIMVILALLIGSSAPFPASMSSALAQDGERESFTPELAEQLAEIYQQKQALTPAQRKIDSSIIQVIQHVKNRLSALAEGEKPRLRNLSTALLKIDDVGNIEVKLNVTSLSDEQFQELEALGMQIGLTLPEYGIIEGSLPHHQVEAVAGLDFVVNVGTPGYPVHNTGDVTSEGDTVLRAAEARTAFGVDGSGVKVGVISDGVTHLSDSVATGDLPSSPAVDVLKEGSGDEGTAMLEIVHDLAPGSPLAFYGPGTSSDMVAGITALAAADCDIIVDDLTYYDEPKFEDGPIAQEARAFYTGGGVYVTSAGNAAQEHYMHQYVRTTGPGSGYDYAHDYGGGDTFNTLTVPNGGIIIPILQWNNQWGQSEDDFDLFLFRSSDDYILARSDNWQDGDDNPYEKIEWENTTGSSLSVSIAVLEYSLVTSPSSLILNYHVFNNFGPTLEYVTPENSVIGHAAVEEVLSTAAASAATPGTIEDFSSRGPGTIYFPSYEERQVPNITGVDGVHTKTGQLGHFSDPFYGTSASAPHVAAIAALVWEADPTPTSSDVFDAITSTAVDLGSAGWDDTWGFGRVDAYEAVASVANTPPVLSSGQVSPTTGDTTTTFTYSVTYTDADNDPPTSITVSIDGAAAQTMTKKTGEDGDYTNGEVYEYTTSGLSTGSHTFQFAASDGVDAATGDTGSHAGPTVENSPPAVTTNAADNVTTDSAILHGSLDYLGDYSSANVSFEWGTTSGALDQETTADAMTSTDAFSANLSSLSSDTAYYFRAKATGSVTVYGGELSFTTKVASYDIPLASGWNLISLPLIPESQSIEDVLAGISVDGVAAYDGATQTWYLYSPGAPSDLTEMTHGKGYWVKVTSPCTLTIEGTVPGLPYDIPLFAGWNLIGLPLIPEPQSIEDVVAGISVDGVAAYDGATQTWYLYSPGAPSDLTEMTHGKGYWVKVTDACTLTVD